ncbi:MAG: TetR/AcrR family transcriptional regulator [Parachlamydiaceae bacterium]|nr:TetR/AcrR family transcriptional regulator [Parachlamydiaceae bacterium]
MSIQDRKAREKEAFRKLIISSAHDIVAQQGLQNLTMRAIANTIDYSQSKIYEFFKNKDQLCEVLFGELCEKLLEVTKNIPKDLKPEKYLSELIMKSVEFHNAFPHSDELFTLVCFGPDRFKIPDVYREMEQYPIAAIRNLKSPHIQSDEDVSGALDVIRCFKIGISNLMSSETSIQGKKRIYNLAENVVNLLLRGWK